MEYKYVTRCNNGGCLCENSSKVIDGINNISCH